MAPHPPVLRPAVHEHDGVAGSRLGDVEAQTAGRDRAVRDAVERRQVQRSSGLQDDLQRLAAVVELVGRRRVGQAHVVGDERRRGRARRRP